MADNSSSENPESQQDRDNLNLIRARTRTSSARSCCCYKLYRKCFYSASTNYVLDYLSLEIQDEEISREFNKTRSHNFDRCFPVMFVVTSFNIALQIGQHLAYKRPGCHIATSVINFSLVITWALARLRSKKDSPLVIFLYLIVECALVNLSYRDMLPGFMINPDKKTEEYRIIVALLITHFINANSFLTTAVMYQAIVIPSVYYMLEA